ncbi:START-like domain-containing protein [Parabacteroides sp. Marseille-P3160]|uniref:START-like domain-containing protein n=1 Tax=Parabacteroides sp. Marseille-P3160 TaxID=1917887 RepID=UPI0009BB9428|nr:START-like domain-containing protein [Parabacteroides sp. Marseille-P3160]
MKKEKFHIEYIFDKVSRRSLWNHLTTPPGLSAWFADDVEINENEYTFYWNKTQEKAELVSAKPEISIRYRWIEEEDPSIYFEFIIHTIELTGSTALEITDFAELDEKADSISLWDSQVEVLKRTLGI